MALTGGAGGAGGEAGVWAGEFGKLIMARGAEDGSEYFERHSGREAGGERGRRIMRRRKRRKS